MSPVSERQEDNAPTCARPRFRPELANSFTAAQVRLAGGPQLVCVAQIGEWRGESGRC
jgi:hypothetical protein